MFSRKIFIFICVGIFLALNLTLITLTSRQSFSVSGLEHLEQWTIALTAPIQLVYTGIIVAVERIWTTYFGVVSAVEENCTLRQKLILAENIENQNIELKRENFRLKKLVNFSSAISGTYIAAQVIARDPSPWYQSIMIDKGTNSGLEKGSPVLVSEGIVGQLIEMTPEYSKVLLLTDRNSAVDALIQNTRVRGIVKGTSQGSCIFVYALKKDTIKPGEIIVSSGFDQVYPKGLRIGHIVTVEKNNSQLFQGITIETSVDFDKLEEVLVFKKEK